MDAYIKPSEGAFQGVAEALRLAAKLSRLRAGGIPETPYW